jgi:hypothetical protein
MSTLAQELKSKLANLSPDDRLELTFFLLDELQKDDDLDWRNAWSEELRRRENEPKYVSAEEVFGKYRRPQP